VSEGISNTLKNSSEVISNFLQALEWLSEGLEEFFLCSFVRIQRQHIPLLIDSPLVDLAGPAAYRYCSGQIMSLEHVDRGSMHVFEHHDYLFSWNKYRNYTIADSSVWLRTRKRKWCCYM
jgi:hypothetical protein